MWKPFAGTKKQRNVYELLGKSIPVYLYGMIVVTDTPIPTTEIGIWAWVSTYVL